MEPLHCGQLLFQSTPPRGGRHGSQNRGHLAGVGFNPRPRVGGDIWPEIPVSHEAMFQSTPPRGGRRSGKGDIFQRRLVSIHAPAWGATLCFVYLLMFAAVSIHAPAWGATRCPCSAHHPFCVSIHAPAWGATVRLDPDAPGEALFQSTPPRGGRPWGTTCFSSKRRFQSTPPRGGRRSTERRPGWCPPGFNPRPRVGGDPMRTILRMDSRLFQSTPPRGGRPFR